MSKLIRKKIMRLLFTLFSYRTMLCLAFLLVYVDAAHAYLDPGTGSMLLAAAIGIISTLIFTLKNLWYKMYMRISGFTHSSRDKTFRTSRMALAAKIVFYSEGRQYWNTFYPVIRALNEQKIPCNYLSSDEDDAGLQFQSEHVQTKYIGKGNKAYFYLNFLEADICVLTTPNLDTLQLRRSKGVKHYCHVIHAPTDIHLYKLFAFDFYDSMLLSGPHQEKSIMHLEKLRKTRPKKLYNTGCPYMDELLIKKNAHADTPAARKPTVLVAPTWGESSILNTNGELLLQMLTERDYNVIVRPHPQSLLVESHFIEHLQQHFSNAHIVWDLSPDNFEALQKADLLVSDRSGIIFDFAFIFEKPVLSHNAQALLKGTEGNDLPWPAWELEESAGLGAAVPTNSVETIPDTAQTLLENPQHYRTAIRELREKSLYNLGTAGKHAAAALIEILNSIEGAEKRTESGA